MKNIKRKSKNKEELNLMKEEIEIKKGELKVRAMECGIKILNLSRGQSDGMETPPNITRATVYQEWMEKCITKIITT